MSRGMIELPGGGYATTETVLTALTLAGRRCDLNYGQFVAATTEAERADIVRKYCAQKRKRRKKSG